MSATLTCETRPNATPITVHVTNEPTDRGADLVARCVDSRIPGPVLIGAGDKIIVLFDLSAASLIAAVEHLIGAGAQRWDIDVHTATVSVDDDLVYVAPCPRGLR